MVLLLDLCYKGGYVTSTAMTDEHGVCYKGGYVTRTVMTDEKFQYNIVLEHLWLVI